METIGSPRSNPLIYMEPDGAGEATSHFETSDATTPLDNVNVDNEDNNAASEIITEEDTICSGKRSLSLPDVVVGGGGGNASKKNAAITSSELSSGCHEACHLTSTAPLYDTNTLLGGGLTPSATTLEYFERYCESIGLETTASTGPVKSTGWLNRKNASSTATQGPGVGGGNCYKKYFNQHIYPSQASQLQNHISSSSCSSSSNFNYGNDFILPHLTSGLKPSNITRPPSLTLNGCFDIGDFLGVTNLSDTDKYYVLNNLWTPSKDYCFPFTRKDNGKMRRFRWEWIFQFSPWLAYSQRLTGPLCTYCVLFPQKEKRSPQTGFIYRCYTNYKKFTECARHHMVSSWHRGSFEDAINFVTMMKRDRETIEISDVPNEFPLDTFLVPYHYKPYLQSVLIPNGFINDRTEKLAQDIALQYENDEVLAICVLKGAFIFYSSLTQKLQHIVSNKLKGIRIMYDFIRIKSYANMTTTNSINIMGIENLQDIQNKNLLIVEDIIDSGQTMEKLLNTLRSYGPKSVRVASLLYKRNPRTEKIYRPDYIGFEIPDVFVVGYGLDYNEYFRDLNHICVLNERGIQKFSSNSTNHIHP